jgi:hypothetical protein
MGTVRRQVTIHRPPDEVWAVVGDPATIHTWFPGMVDSAVTTTDEGTTRVVTTQSGLPLPEQIVTIDPILRRFQYRLTTPLVRDHLGTIDVFALEGGNSLVSYGTDCEPDAVALIIGGATGAALAELRRQLETEGPA